MRKTDITLDTIVTRSPEHVFNDIDGEIMLLGIESGNYYGFNAMLSFIWNQMDEPISLSAIAEKILAAFEVERAVCESDLLAVFNRMLDDQLIEIQ